jgi:hypothetical protein
MNLFRAAGIGVRSRKRACSQLGIRFKLAKSYSQPRVTQEIKCCEFFRLRRNFSAQSFEFSDWALRRAAGRMALLDLRKGPEVGIDSGRTFSSHALR